MNYSLPSATRLLVAAIIFWAALGGVFVSDPDFISRYS